MHLALLTEVSKGSLSGTTTKYSKMKMHHLYHWLNTFPTCSITSTCPWTFFFYKIWWSRAKRQWQHLRISRRTRGSPNKKIPVVRNSRHECGQTTNCNLFGWLDFQPKIKVGWQFECCDVFSFFSKIFVFNQLSSRQVWRLGSDINRSWYWSLTLANHQPIHQLTIDMFKFHPSKNSKPSVALDPGANLHLFTLHNLGITSRWSKVVEDSLSRQWIWIVVGGGWWWIIY